MRLSGLKGTVDALKRQLRQGAADRLPMIVVTAWQHDSDADVTAMVEAQKLEGARNAGFGAWPAEVECTAVIVQKLCPDECPKCLARAAERARGRVPPANDGPGDAA